MTEEYICSIDNWMTVAEKTNMHHFCKDLLEYKDDDANFFALVSSINKNLNAFKNGCKYVKGDDCPIFKAFKKGRRVIAREG